VRWTALTVLLPAAVAPGAIAQPLDIAASVQVYSGAGDPAGADHWPSDHQVTLTPGD
jgi:hypothetical protein